MAMLTSSVRPSRHQRSHTSAACDVRQMRCVWKSILACGCFGSSLHVRLFHSLHSLRHVIMLPVVNSLSVNTVAESLVLDYSRLCTTWHSKILSWPNVLHGITSDENCSASEEHISLCSRPNRGLNTQWGTGSEPNIHFINNNNNTREFISLTQPT